MSLVTFDYVYNDLTLSISWWSDVKEYLRYRIVIIITIIINKANF